MTATTVELHVAAREIAPRGARPLGQLAAQAYIGARSLGERIARVFDREPTRYESIEAVLNMARQYEHTQPSFAADLRAAACRFDADER
ncbi:hypothetical protein M8A51_20240 [Schlegelella sp. S2-27]|uniref:Uncharacterized protein n=1 Tax=Caldimonas mangrovi TaxID=2944811 RepID=A0ABT0YSY4_9BURK|nr:hypothetical protein [Caldimonas mangrovi]MCM5681864.1 hypothetical protein [Caldimonas mangrovi]